MKTLIKNGTIVTAQSEYVADIAIDGEKIVMIGAEIPGEFDAVIDAAGKYVLPGGVDRPTQYNHRNGFYDPR